MDLYDVMNFTKQNYPGKEAKFSFPKECHRQIEIMMTEGKLHPMHHIECHHVLVEVEGQAPMKFKIQPHRMTVDLPTLKSFLDDSLK